MLIKSMAFLLLFSGCALFKGTTSLKNQDKQKLLEAVKVTGEGKGRLSLGQNQYVFSVDSILNEDKDWILAVAIPLHGEEVMILPDLRKSFVTNAETETFEQRIKREFRARRLERAISSDEFLKELRSLIRFIQGKDLGLTRHCDAQKDEMLCTLDGEKYLVSATEKKFYIQKFLGKGKTLEVVAKNLTDSFFSNTDFHLYTNGTEFTQREPAFSLELFW